MNKRVKTKKNRGRKYEKRPPLAHKVNTNTRFQPERMTLTSSFICAIALDVAGVVVEVLLAGDEKEEEVEEVRLVLEVMAFELLMFGGEDLVLLKLVDDDRFPRPPPPPLLPPPPRPPRPALPLVLLLLFPPPPPPPLDVLLPDDDMVLNIL
jgi:hypothetical protein